MGNPEPLFGDKFLFLKQLGCYVDGKVKYENLVSSNEMIKVEILP